MKVIHLLVIGILLANFGVTLSADVFERDSHIAISASEVSNYQEHQAHDREHKDVSCDSDSKDKNHCPDPCHAGQPHFGHTAFLLGNAKVVFAHAEAEASNINVTQFRVDDPFLEGPRRPPKTS